ncbi:methyltransferase domain-containing protein [Hymenobacter segetis]|uniref:Class I SAM-dependent methyltransferase n=1 Tax=Hymenobacter segetis TaxID=2025509 RepID=A0ABU9LXV4_9BACT
MSAPTITFNGTIPQQYDDYLGPFLFEPYALDLADRIDYAPVTNVLELACGTGRLTNLLLERLPSSAQLTATDLNPDMMAVARKRTLAPNVTWAVVDISAIPYEDNQFDLIASQFGFMFVPDKLKALTEIHRVLAPGGKLIFNTWGAIQDNTAWAIVNKVLHAFLGGNPVPQHLGPFSMADAQVVLQALTEAGFHHVNATSVKKTGLAETAAIAAQGFIQGLPFATAIQEKDPSLLPKIQAAVEQEFSAQLGNHPLRTPLHALVFEASK